MAYRLHYAPYPTRARVFGMRTNFIRARTTSRVGPSTDKILVRVPETSVGTDEAKFTRLNSSIKFKVTFRTVCFMGKLLMMDCRTYNR